MKKNSPATCFAFTLLTLIVYIGIVMILLSQSYSDMLAGLFVMLPITLLLVISALIISILNINTHHHFLSYISLIINILMVILLPIIFIFK